MAPRLVEVAPGRRLVAAGSSPGPPSVLFDAGTYGIYADGANLVRALAAIGVPAVTYTRAGLLGSDPPPAPPTPDFHGDDMLRLLDSLGAEGPVVLVGHSMAGLRLHRLAERRPDRVRGLVLVDAMVPGLVPRSLLRAFAAGLLPVADVLPLMLDLVGTYPNAMRLGGGERADKLASVGAADHLRATQREVAEAAACAFPIRHHAPMVLMPAGRIAAGTSTLAERSGARLIDMSRWGHASVLSPEASSIIAKAVAQAFPPL